MKKRLYQWSAAAIACAALCGGYAIWRPAWPWSQAPDAGAGAKAEKDPTTVVITPEKFASMKIASVSVARRRVQDERTVPGMIDYRRVRRVELKAPVDTVVEKVHVKPGDVVHRGTRLADLTSPDVGLARAEVEKSQSDLKIANRALEWAEEITHNLDDLLKSLEAMPAPQAVEKEFDNKRLGGHRQEVMAAYSKYVLADKLWQSAEALLKTGSISEQTVRQRESNREVAKDQYLAVREQSPVEAWQAREKARQSQNLARRQVEVAKQKLRTLLGAFTAFDESADEATPLTHFHLIAPFEGTVEQRSAAEGQRVAAGTLLFVVANTDVLEVLAEIREGVWQEVAPFFSAGADAKRVVKVIVPNLGEDREFEAVVDYMARVVDRESRAVPLVALLDNPKHEFFPGMFAWVKIPAGHAEEALVVPPAAVRTHDKQDFVFVEDQYEPRTFHRVDVKVGRETPEGVTIASGLREGQRVVVEGVFLLKSELLLEPEEE
jgi:RND family efflux transporter MFP subunit